MVRPEHGSAVITGAALAFFAVVAAAGCGGETVDSLARRFADRRAALETLKDTVISVNSESGVEVVALNGGKATVRFTDARTVDSDTAASRVNPNLLGEVILLLRRLGASSVGASCDRGNEVFVVMDSGGAVGGGLGYVWRQDGERPSGMGHIERIDGETNWFSFVQ